MMRKVTLLVIACLGSSILTPLAANAATSQLTQTINPIQCTYTVLMTGTTTLTPTLCSSQLVPTLSSVTTTLRPQLTGTYASIQASSLRVFVGQNWFTLGVSSALTAVGDTWTLDLTNTALTLAPSTTYTIIVEALTINGYLLSSVYQDVLTTQAAPLVPHIAQPLTPKTPEILPTQINTNIPINLVSPLGQSGMSHYYYAQLDGTTSLRADSTGSPHSYIVRNWPILAMVTVLVGTIFVRVGYPAWKRRQQR